MSNKMIAFRKFLINGSYFPGSSTNWNIKDTTKLVYLQMQDLFKGYMVIRWVHEESFPPSDMNSPEGSGQLCSASHILSWMWKLVLETFAT